MKRNRLTRVLCFILAAAMLLTGCQGAQTPDEYNTKAPDRTVPHSDTRDITLDFDTALGQFTVTDGRNGKVWSNGLTDAYYGQEVINLLHQKNKMCLYTVTYKNADDILVAHRNTDEEMLTEFVAEGDRITAHCAVTDTAIAFDVVFELKANTLVVSVPADSIREGDYERLITIELLPFLGASVNTEDGYILFPDGSGALYEFKDTVSASAFPYEMQVYSNYFYDYDEYVKNVASGIKYAMLPVFGVKQGNGAFLGVITKGQADTSLTMYPSGYIYAAGRVAPTFNYRYAYSMETANEGETVILYEEERSTSDFEVQYTFLANELANYSGMAQTYRRFLLDNGMLNRSDYTAAVSLDLLLSLQKPLLLWTQNVSTSRFSDGTAMLEALQAGGVGNVKMNLLGWQSNGYNIYPSHFPVSSAAGGAGGLKDLLESAGTYDAVVALNDNFLLAQSDQGGYSKREDVASSVKNEAYTDRDKENFLLDFRRAAALFEKQWIPKATEHRVTAVNLDDIARLFYANGAKKTPLKRTATETVISGMLRTAADTFSHVAVSGGNQYGLAYADFLYDIPESSSKDFLFDRDVPFFQMVVHGAIAYSPEIPGNFSDNYRQTVLKWAEYGFVPYYSVSESGATEIKDCYSQGVFVSRFDDIRDKILATVQELAPLSATQKAAMVSHEVLDNGLVKVGYDNGITVWVNYSQQTLSADGVTLPPESFVTQSATP